MTDARHPLLRAVRATTPDGDAYAVAAAAVDRVEAALAAALACDDAAVAPGQLRAALVTLQTEVGMLLSRGLLVTTVWRDAQHQGLADRARRFGPDAVRLVPPPNTTPLPPLRAGRGPRSRFGV